MSSNHFCPEHNIHNHSDLETIVSANTTNIVSNDTDISNILTVNNTQNTNITTNATNINNINNQRHQNRVVEYISGFLNGSATNATGDGSAPSFQTLTDNFTMTGGTWYNICRHRYTPPPLIPTVAGCNIIKAKVIIKFQFQVGRVDTTGLINLKLLLGGEEITSFRYSNSCVTHYNQVQEVTYTFTIDSEQVENVPEGILNSWESMREIIILARSYSTGTELSMFKIGYFDGTSTGANDFEPPHLEIITVGTTN